MPRVYIETYGCQMNVSGSELLFGVLGREGYVRTDDPAEADVLLVNTCAVRDHAEQKVLSRLGELKQYKRRGDVLGVVGCMAQRLGARLLERVPQVDLVIGPEGYRGLPELIARARAGERAAEVEFKSWEHYEDVPPVRGTPISAFVTVQRGCDYRCTFCIVPMTRGPQRSRKLQDVVREVTDLASGGTTEVTLLGQTVNSYDDGSHDFDDPYTFKYSLREGTPATRLKDLVPDAVAGERLERLVAAVRDIARRKNVALVGSTHEVLVEDRAKRGDLLQGRTRTNKIALFA